MAPSQLKQLKASLREHGVLGPQKSKKIKKSTAKDGQMRMQRNTTLQSIRERFNPFEIKAPARRAKFDIASNKSARKVIERPGVTRGLGEERRRETLLKEMRSRNKVGGMVDRRFGENDPTMTPEERAAERFARQALRTSKKNSMFNLEDGSEEEMVLTHGGQTLDFDEGTKDDFEEDGIGSIEQDDLDDRPTKRMRVASGDLADFDDSIRIDDGFEHRKTKNEIMKEVIAKSKMYKAERQAVKADDDDLRAELDKGMSEFYKALQQGKIPSKQLPSPPQTDTEPTMDPGRAAILAGKSREAADREYEANLRQMKLEARSKPSVRTKTEEEKAAERAAKLEDLERKRLRRMRGETESSEDGDVDDEDAVAEDDGQDDAEAFGLEQPSYSPRPQLDVEDEDEFVLDDIIASDSEAEMASDAETSEAPSDFEDDGDDDFINGLVLPKPLATTLPKTSSRATSENLAYTFPCPQTHRELLAITESTKLEDLPTIVQRIRALYHPRLAQENEEKLVRFAGALLAHIAYLVDGDEAALSYSVVESLLRHLHSMAKSQPEGVGLAARNHLRLIAEQRPNVLTAGDLIILTGVSTIFPTSDHFHAVTTPAMLTIARYLGHSAPQTMYDLIRGAYGCSLAIKYQNLAQRYVPEVINYIFNALASLSPIPLSLDTPIGLSLEIPTRQPNQHLHLRESTLSSQRTISFDILRGTPQSPPNQTMLLHAFMRLAGQAIELWQSKSALPEIARPLQLIFDHLLSRQCKTKLSEDLQLVTQEISTMITTFVSKSISSRKPLLLHNHKPLAIKTSIPQFIENFNPDRHYDPDRERAELSKLKAEHKKERKGAMRELRKDANFIAREQLREKKAKDEAYEKKFKRLIAEIQGEEGREAKEYEREKKKRTRSRM